MNEIAREINDSGQRKVALEQVLRLREGPVVPRHQEEHGVGHDGDCSHHHHGHQVAELDGNEVSSNYVVPIL